MIHRSGKKTGVLLGIALVLPAALGCHGEPPAPGGPPGGGGSDPGKTLKPLYQSGSRLRARLLSAGGGAVRFLGWEDTKAKQMCAFHRAEDGEMRCLPIAGQGTTIAYLDSACTAPVAVRTCGATDRYVVTETGKAACDPEDTPYAAYEVSGQLDDAPTFALYGGTCMPAAPASPGDELHAVTKIPANLFVGGVLASEPHGDRLSVQLLRAGDGSREARGIHDALLDVACDPREDDRGRIRCAPATTALGGGNFFEDSGCLRPLLADIGSSPDCPAPRFADGPGDSSSCAKGFHAVQIGRKVSSLSVFQGEPSLCLPAAFLPPDWAFYEVGPAVDPASLPALTVKEEGKGRLRATTYMAPDGAPLAQGSHFIDSESGEACIPRHFADGSVRCVPQDVPRFSLYADPVCVVPLAAVPKDASCPMPAPKLGILSAVPANPDCPGVQVVKELHRIGNKWSGAIVYSKSSSNGCAGLDPSQLNVDIYEVGAAVDPSVLVEVSETTE